MDPHDPGGSDVPPAGSRLVRDVPRGSAPGHTARCLAGRHGCRRRRLPIPPRAAVATAGPSTTRTAGRPFRLLLRSAGRPVVLALLAAVAVAALLPASSHAAFGVQSFSATTQNADTSLFTQAAGHPFNGITAFTLNSVGGLPDGGVLKNIHVDIPPGVIPDPESLPKCTSATPTLANCGVATQIGTTTINALVSAGPPPVIAPFTVPVFNMEPPDGLVSDFAFILPVGPAVHIEGSVRDTSDYGVVFDIRGPDRRAAGHGRHPALLGRPGRAHRRRIAAALRHHPHLLRPALHDAAHRRVPDGPDGDRLGHDAHRRDRLRRVPFTPTIAVAPDTTRRDSPTGGSVTLHVPALRNPPASSPRTSRTRVITLPEGVTLNPSAANGLEACTDAQLAQGHARPGRLSRRVGDRHRRDRLGEPRRAAHRGCSGSGSRSTTTPTACSCARPTRRAWTCASRARSRPTPSPAGSRRRSRTRRRRRSPTSR